MDREINRHMTTTNTALAYCCAVTRWVAADMVPHCNTGSKMACYHLASDIET